MSRPQTATRPGTPYGRPVTDRTNPMSIWSLVLSILTIGGLGSLAGIWLGAAATRRISQTGERGRGLAIAGIVVGIVTLLFAISYWIYFAMHTGGAGGGHGGYGY